MSTLRPDQSPHTEAPTGLPTVVVVVADGLGIGGAPDAAAFSTSTANTLAHATRAAGGVSLPTLGRWGLGNLTSTAGVAPATAPAAVVARAVEHSAGNDTPTGHWELFGCVTEFMSPTFPDGFPSELVELLCEAWGVPGVLCNAPMSGLEVLERFGDEHLATGLPILYTSADSVLQVAAHTDVWSPEVLVERCEAARRICDRRWPIGRVIARHFDGAGGNWRRASEHRRDLALPPPRPTLVDAAADAGLALTSVGKIDDIFGNCGFSACHHPHDLPSAVEHTLDAAADTRRAGGGLVVANLVEFDYRGHARDPRGFADALVVADAGLARLEASLRPGDVIAVCADHGNDPTFTTRDDGAATLDHTRERTPLLVRTLGRAGRDAGVVDMADLAPTLAAALGIEPAFRGRRLDGTSLAR